MTPEEAAKKAQNANTSEQQPEQKKPTAEEMAMATFEATINQANHITLIQRSVTLMAVSTAIIAACTVFKTLRG